MKTKVCTKCGEEKAVSEFYKNKSYKNGISTRCKKCLSNYSNEYYKKNKNKFKEYYKKNKNKLLVYGNEYYRENKNKVLEYTKKYYKKNKSYYQEYYQKYREENKEYYQKYREENKKYNREYSKNYYKENKKKISEYVKLWSKKNPDKRRAVAQNRRARVAGNGGSFTAKEWKDLCKKYDYKCLCCGKKKKLTADHVIPVSKGGTSYISNIQPLCRSCNSSKGNHSSADYR